MTFVPTLITGAGPMNTTTTPMGGLALMRRPALHHPHPAATGWSHPYAPNPAICYADGADETSTADETTAPQAPKPAPPNARTFTQEEMEKVAAKEKAQGKRAGASEALTQFAADNGFASPEDAKAFIEEARKAREAQLSDQEKREQALADREAKLAAREAAAITSERNANRRAVLVGLGATGDDLDDAAALLRIEDNADDTVVQEAAAKLKERRPELFGIKPAAAPTSLPPAPGGAPAGGPPARPASTGRPGDRGREMARIRGHLKNTA